MCIAQKTSFLHLGNRYLNTNIKHSCTYTHTQMHSYTFLYSQGICFDLFYSLMSFRHSYLSEQMLLNICPSTGLVSVDKTVFIVLLIKLNSQSWS